MINTVFTQLILLLILCHSEIKKNTYLTGAYISSSDFYLKNALTKNNSASGTPKFLFFEASTKRMLRLNRFQFNNLYDFHMENVIVTETENQLTQNPRTVFSLSIHWADVKLKKVDLIFK